MLANAPKIRITKIKMAIITDLLGIKIRGRIIERGRTLEIDIEMIVIVIEINMQIEGGDNIKVEDIKIILDQDQDLYLGNTGDKIDTEMIVLVLVLVKNTSIRGR